MLMFAAYIVVTGIELTYKQWVFGKVSPGAWLTAAIYKCGSRLSVSDW